VISADAGVWLAFLKDEPSARALRDLLHEQRVVVHPFVLLELRLRLRAPERTRILADLEHLASCPVDPPEVVSAFVEDRGLARFQVGIVGAHLLASAARHGDELWATERELKSAAAELGIAFDSTAG
jgi:predicted nucleic acid-binding protein